MTERGEPSPEFEAFKESFREGLEGLFAFLEASPEEPVPPDPFSMGIDDRTFEELSDLEKVIAELILLEELGLSEGMERAKVRSYQSETPDFVGQSLRGTIEINVYRTNKEGIYLQELVFPDDQKRWVVGPDKNI